MIYSVTGKLKAIGGIADGDGQAGDGSHDDRDTKVTVPWPAACKPLLHGVENT